jgi:hypothetical protein
MLTELLSGGKDTIVTIWRMKVAAGLSLFVLRDLLSSEVEPCGRYSPLSLSMLTSTYRHSVYYHNHYYLAFLFGVTTFHNLNLTKYSYIAPRFLSQLCGVWVVEHTHTVPQGGCAIEQVGVGRYAR